MLYGEESGPLAHGHDSRAKERNDVRVREGEWAKEEGRRGEERSCSEDSSEAGGPTRGTAEDEGEGRHSSEAGAYARHRGRGEGDARRGRQRRGERNAAARPEAIREYNTLASTLRT